MADQLMGLLNSEADVSYRGGLLPLLRRVIPDIGGDDISEFEGPLELATPALAYDPVRNMALTGAMLRGHIPVDEGLLTQTMVDAPLVGGLLAGATGAVPKGAVLGANVFHGGPHRWSPEPDFPHGRPRLDKIGTGEGAQAYGYGFYSADAPDVAKNYAPRDYEAEEIMMSRYKQAESDGDYEAMSIWEDAMMHETPNEIRARYADPDYDDVTRETANRVADELEKIPQKSAFYKLDIPDADVGKYLDYDKPLSEQPKSVQDALRRMANDIAETEDYDRFEHLALAAIRGEHPRGGSTKTITGGDLYNDLTSFGRGDTSRQASMKLKDYGIPGLKYFDADSRGVPKADRTRNYVTWDQDVLDRSKMLERDGVTLGANKSPTAALPGLLEQQYMDESERLLRDSQGLLGATQRRQNQLNRQRQFYASGGV